MRTALVVAGIVVVGLAWAHGRDALEYGPLHSKPSAAIVDQLGFTDKNETLVAEATRLLTQSGFAVDYYPSDSVTVDFYASLAHRNYDMLILRTHSVRQKSDAEVVLFTTEIYDPFEHFDDERRGRLGRVAYNHGPQVDENGESWFSVRPALLESSASRFDGALVLMMGCDGMVNDSLASAFLEKGATTYIGWDGQVTAWRTDQATVRILEALLIEQMSTQQAVDAAMLAAPDFYGLGTTLRFAEYDSFPGPNAKEND